MLFNSFEFAVFFPVVTGLFFLLPHRYRWALLLAASCFFYMFFRPVYILILLLTIVIDYYAGIWISKEPDKRKRKYLLLLSICANVGVLVVFKYYDFIAENLNQLLGIVGHDASIPFLHILLPIGLSFHTFQAMSYTIEVYRGHQAPERHFGIYALYVMFYPQLVAGPIERPQNLIHQFHEEKKFSPENVRSGLILICWGLFKKVVIADRLSFFVDQVYGNVTEYTGIPLVLSTVAFAFQIYCDFSGYSDIAIGSARVMGFNLMSNFDRPYRSTSLTEFWRRWHISLSTWFRDYVYVPMGGKYVRKARRYLNLVMVFLISGFWHGANWTFVIWGGIHGSIMVAEQELRSRFTGLLHGNSWLLTCFKRGLVFGVVCMAWIFFRAGSLDDARYITMNLFRGIPDQISLILSNEHMYRLKLLYLQQPSMEFLVAFLSIMILMLVQAAQKSLTVDQWLISKGVAFRWTFYYGTIGAILLFGVFNKSDFIYFQF
ncbi:MAG TPA: MBOAT family O-acyltransferase [Cyclobacteriaceae bacterium]|nr:MBOAT family O-acyltransferase [Cyclobacteriaceae bacterium]